MATSSSFFFTTIAFYLTRTYSARFFCENVQITKIRITAKIQFSLKFYNCCYYTMYDE